MNWVMRMVLQVSICVCVLPINLANNVPGSIPLQAAIQEGKFAVFLPLHGKLYAGSDVIYVGFNKNKSTSSKHSADLL